MRSIPPSFSTQVACADFIMLFTVTPIPAAIVMNFDKLLYMRIIPALVGIASWPVEDTNVRSTL